MPEKANTSSSIPITGKGSSSLGDILESNSIDRLIPSSTNKIESISDSKLFLKLIDPVRNFCKFQCNPNQPGCLPSSPSILSTISDRINLYALQLQLPPIDTEGDGSSMMTPTVDADGNIEDVSFLPKINILDFEIAQKTLQEVNEVLAGNINTFLRGNVPILLVGACLGAAISAGVAMGMFGMLQYLSTSFDSSVHDQSSKQKSLLRRMHSSIKNVLRPFFFKNEIQHHYLQKHDEVAKDTSNTIQSKIKVMKVQPRQIHSNSNEEEEVRDCFDAITLNLGKQLLTWNHVYRITLYHTSQNSAIGKDLAYQKLLKEYPVRKDLVTTIVQVSKLEKENINVEIEAIVCTE